MIPSLSPVTAGAGLPLPELVALARRHAFAGVEYSICEASELVSQNGMESVATIFEAEPKVLPIVFDLPVEWRKSEATFQEELRRLPALAKTAQDLDCTRCTTWVLPASDKPAAEYAARSIARLAQVAAVLSDEGVRLGLEFLGPQHLRSNIANVWFYDVHGALHAVEQIEAQAITANCGLLLDAWHWFNAGNSMMDLASIPLEKIVHVHMSDAPPLPLAKQKDDVRLLPGESGVIDINGFLQTLAALGYDGPVAVETFSEELNALPPEEAAARASAATHRVLAAAGITPMRLL